MSGHRAGSIGLGSAVTKHALALRELSDRIQIVGGGVPANSGETRSPQRMTFRRLTRWRQFSMIDR
jgi:hypothetical protein